MTDQREQALAAFERTVSKMYPAGSAKHMADLALVRAALRAIAEGAGS